MDLTKIDESLVTNPKRISRKLDADEWYTYYAGYSKQFVKSVLENYQFDNNSVVLDPWNGAGTTTTAASNLGVTSYGLDINPVMSVIARSDLISRNQVQDLSRILSGICEKSNENYNSKIESVEFDPLTVWFQPSAVIAIRNIERAIFLEFDCWDLSVESKLTTLVGSSKCALLYVFLFQTVRNLLGKFFSSNPTWIKTPENKKQRIRPNKEKIHRNISDVSQRFLEKLEGRPVTNYAGDSRILVSDSRSIPLSDNSVNLVLTSPPYCTRIDYAVKMRPELALLGLGENQKFESLRRSMIGTTMINNDIKEPNSEWGWICLGFLDQLKRHYSKASGEYYYKNHLQYFSSIFESLREISRVLVQGGDAVFVVQDSYYKEIKNDLPGVFSEMAEVHGLDVVSKKDFIVSRDMSSLNKSSKKYGKTDKKIESVMFFRKRNLE